MLGKVNCAELLNVWKADLLGWLELAEHASRQSLVQLDERLDPLAETETHTHAASVVSGIGILGLIAQGRSYHTAFAWPPPKRRGRKRDPNWRALNAVRSNVTRSDKSDSVLMKEGRIVGSILI